MCGGGSGRGGDWWLQGSSTASRFKTKLRLFSPEIKSNSCEASSSASFAPTRLRFPAGHWCNAVFWHIGFIQSEQRSAGIRSHGVSVWKVSSSLQFQCLESVYVQVFYWNESTVIQANSCNVQIQRFAILSHPPSILLIRSFHISLVFDWIWFRSNS